MHFTSLSPERLIVELLTAEERAELGFESPCDVIGWGTPVVVRSTDSGAYYVVTRDNVTTWEIFGTTIYSVLHDNLRFQLHPGTS